MDHPVPLSTLEVTQYGRIRKVAARGAIAIRILEMGLVPGTMVRLVKRAPMGDPLELALRGYHISLRMTEAALIEVVRQ